MLSTDKQTNRQTDKLTNATKNITSFAKDVITLPSLMSHSFAAFCCLVIRNPLKKSLQLIASFSGDSPKAVLGFDASYKARNGIVLNRATNCVTLGS